MYLLILLSLSEPFTARAVTYVEYRQGLNAGRWVVAGTVTQFAKLIMSRQQNMDKQNDRPPHFYRPKSRTQRSRFVAH